MSRIESPAETVRKFANTTGWKNASQEELAGDFFSISSETNLTWDQYYYEEKEGKLFDPTRNQFVAGTGGTDATEEAVIKELEDWFLSHDSGVAVWISPRDHNRLYPEEKLIIHRIFYKPDGTKVLVCASHQFKKIFTNPEEIRKFIFTESDSEEAVFGIIEWLKKISEKKVALTEDFLKRRRQAEYFAYKFWSGTPIDRIIYEMTQTGFLGDNPIGCNTTSVSINSMSYSQTMTSIFQYEMVGSSFPCPRCHGPIPSGLGITTCPYCGLTKEQAGSTCG